MLLRKKGFDLVDKESININVEDQEHQPQKRDHPCLLKPPNDFIWQGFAFDDLDKVKHQMASIQNRNWKQV